MKIFRNARIVTADTDFSGALCVKDGLIADVGSGSHGSSGEDWNGDYLLPGLVELHTDLELVPIKFSLLFLVLFRRNDCLGILDSTGGATH